MKYPKKSLGQNFLIDKNIIKKIISLVEIKNKNIVEIGPGKGALTHEIFKLKPETLTLVEKDFVIAKELGKYFLSNKNVKIFNKDVLKLDLENLCKKNSVIFGNLPFNISSQILVKILKFKFLPSNVTDIIFMFQKELGEKIIAKFLTSDYCRLSILTNFRLNILNNFVVSPNCFFPKPKVHSMVIHFQPKKKINFKIKKISNLEKVTNIIFSNKRKMINKNIKKLLSNKKIKKIIKLDLKARPSDINPDIYYKITELYEED